MSLLLNRNSTVAFRKSPGQQAIEIDPPDDEYDVEAGINSSTCALMHSFEEERPTSLVASIRESAKSSKRKVKYYCSFILAPVKKLLSTFKLLIIIGLYSFAGAHLFMYLEVPTDLEAKEDDYHQRKIAREVMVLNLRAIHYDNREDREERWKHAILKFESDMGLDEPVIETVWTFWMSFLYAGTIFTTIGYGNIACKTRAGQIATMIYAFAGIPIMLVMLSSLNNFLLKWIKIIANGFCDLLLYTGVRLGIAVIRQDEVQKRLRYTKIARKLNRQEVVGSLAISGSEENRLNSVPDEEEDVEPDPPVLSTLFATVGWIMLSAAVFCLFEDWTFFTSFYFCFISLTTIGLGDVTPANPQYMIATFGVVIVGLSMLTVCIDVIKEKIALMYMALLQKLLKDYMEAVKSGDPNAASAMMAGFQGKGKYLMQFMSKNDGAKAMNRFKEDCSKKGIDPPPVLTNINPETGMPAFANASKEEFNDYIEVAEEKFAEEQQQKLIAQSPLSKSSDFLQPASRRTSISLPQKISLEVQAGGTTIGKFHDLGSQTQHESSDEGIQTDYSFDLDFEVEKYKKVPEKIMADAETQYEIAILTSIGIQPEVSSIYHGVEFDKYSSDDDEDEVSDYSEFSSESEEDLEVKIEITPFTDDDESQHSEIKSSPAKLSIFNNTKVAKSASVDSAETVIHVEPEKKEESTKRKRLRRRNKKVREHELRFLKNTGNQTSPILFDCSTQYEVLTSDLKSRSRKCQTKLSSINQAQLQGIRENLKRRESQMSRAESEWSEVAEVHLDLSLVAFGIDEAGQVVDVPKTALNLKLQPQPTSESSSSGKESKEELSEEESLEELEELELFTNDAQAQTDFKIMVDRQEFATPRMLDVSRNCSSQTTFSTFHLSQKVYESASTSSEEDEPKDVERLQKSKSEVFFMTETGVQTSNTSFYLEEGTETLKEEEMPLFLRNSESQTIDFIDEYAESTIQTDEPSLSFEDSEVQTIERLYVECDMQTDEISIPDREFEDSEVQTINTVYSESTMQTDSQSFDNSEVQTTVRLYSESTMQTDGHGSQSFEDSEVQTVDRLYCEGTMQTECQSFESSEVQTVDKLYAECTMQTDQNFMASEECQTEEVDQMYGTCTMDSTECQTEPKSFESSEVQTVVTLYSEGTMQTDEQSTSSEECQTDFPSSEIISTGQESECSSTTHSEAEIQVDLTCESLEIECQTEPTTSEEIEVQTELETSNSESQTEKVTSDSVEMQTDKMEATSSEVQTEELKTDIISSEMQTDDFQKETESSEMQTEPVHLEFQQTQTDQLDQIVPERVPVSDNATQSEILKVIDSETQYTPTTFEDRPTQVKPTSINSHTQHSTESDAKSCQTETITLKNKRSQEEEEEDVQELILPITVDNESQAEVERNSVNLSPIFLENATSNSFTMTEPGSFEEKEVQVDRDNLESEQKISGPLWSDFDYTPEFEDDEVVDGETQTEEESEADEKEDVPVGTCQDFRKSVDSLTDEFAVQCTPESSDVKTQTVKFKKRIEEKTVEAKVEMSTSTVQATTEMSDQGAGGGVGEDDWLQVYVQELDEERRLRMSDIGIQTGVLARVQHMYTRPISDDVAATSSAPITLRKSSDSSEHMSVKTAKSSEESLAPTAGLATSESDEHLWVDRSKATRQGSIKKTRSEGDKKVDKTNIVQDLRAKFEMKSPPPPPPKDEN